jgi:hypothetical protein
VVELFACNLRLVYYLEIDLAVAPRRRRRRRRQTSTFIG